MSIETKCLNCGSSLDTMNNCSNCNYSSNKVGKIEFSPVQPGWECPRCKSIHAPWVSRCYCSNTSI